MNICVVGTGYVGLVAGTCLSDFGMHVICVDKDKSKIDMLNNGDVPIYEIGLKELIARNVKLERLSFTTDLKNTINRSLCIFLGVGTPENKDGTANLQYIFDVCDEIADTMNDYKVIVIKSTVPVGTAQTLRKRIKERLKKDIDFDIVSNPEFLREGSAVNDFLRPDRVVIGSKSEKALAIVRDIYRPLYLLETPIVSTSNETAELIKYASNTMLALKISFINEMANLCDKVGGDVYQVATAMGMDKRIGSKFLHPGPGYGGSCFPKDVSALAKVSDSFGYDFKISKAILEVNALQKENVVKKSEKMLGTLKGKTICLLGLAFKPNTDDIREAPALYAAKRMMEEGATINAYDPIAMDEAKKEIKGINYFNDAYAACTKADLVIIMTEWNEFRDLHFDRIKEQMNEFNVYDTRNIYNAKTIREFGFNYICTGRPVE